MTAPMQLASPALLRSLASKPPMSVTDIAVMNGFLSGSMPTKPANRKIGTNPFDRYLRNTKTLFGRAWQRSPDRAASVARRRKLGGSSGLPDTIRHKYTEGERAVLTVVAGEVKHHGICDLAIDRIAAVAGVSRTTVQNAMRVAAIHGHIVVTPRPRHGQKNLTNLVRIVSPEWSEWIKRGPSLARSIGFNSLHPTKNTDKKPSVTENENATRDKKRGSGAGASGAGSGNDRHRGCG